ncbi:MAG: helix-turn-helix transcriptional regulator [Clostridiales Family XIII bacterium]|nr:helix-turn-helix transcriptional regulator [Clostridiales Family XIII bacterium]
MSKEAIRQFDFRPLGEAIKSAREHRGWTREYLAEQLDITAYHLKSVENNGVNPGFQLFYKLITLFHISVDAYFYPAEPPKETSLRFELDKMLNDCEEDALYIVKSTVDGITNVRLRQNDK